MIPVKLSPGSSMIEQRVEVRALQEKIKSIEVEMKKVGKCDPQGRWESLLKERNAKAEKVAGNCDQLVPYYQRKDDAKSAQDYSDKANQTRRRMRGEP